MNVGSLFSGIGGFDLGLERAGMRVLWQCESDPYCRRVLKQHWPDVPCWANIRDVGNPSTPPPVDLLCGGFPCQPVSVAGFKRGQDDERWLWPEFARVIGLLRPRYVLVENVPGLLARGMGDVLGDLAALGYDAEWDCLPAAAFGAPHLRDRVWVLAYPNDDRRDSQGEGEARDEGEALAPARALGELGGVGGGRPDSGSRGCGGEALADASRDAEAGAEASSRSERERVGSGGEPSEVRDSGSAGLEGVGATGAARYADWWRTEPDVGRVADGVPARVDRLSALGNALVPQIAEWIGHRLMAYEAAA